MFSTVSILCTTTKIKIILIGLEALFCRLTLIFTNGNKKKKRNFNNVNKINKQTSE